MTLKRTALQLLILEVDNALEARRRRYLLHFALGAFILFALIGQVDLQRTPWVFPGTVIAVGFAVFMIWGSVRYSSWDNRNEVPVISDKTVFVSSKICSLLDFVTIDEFEDLLVILINDCLPDTPGRNLVKSEIVGKSQHWREFVLKNRVSFP